MDTFPDVKKALDKFPGPITFVEPPARWRFITPVALLMTAACLCMLFVAPYPTGHWYTFRLVKRVGIGVLGTIFFGANTVIGLTRIFMPAASSLGLDESGFIVRNFLRTRVFTWNQVSDFITNSPQGSRRVKFRTDAGEIGERNGVLPDMYGFSARDLLQLMIMWQQLASKSRVTNPGVKSAEPDSATSPAN